MGFLSKVFDFIKSPFSLITGAIGAALIVFGGPLGATVGYGLLASLAISAIQAGLAPEVGDIGADLTTPVRQSIAESVFLYGETVTAGSFVYNAKQDGSNALFDGDESVYIHKICVLAPHEVESIEIYSLDGYLYDDGSNEEMEDVSEDVEANRKRKENIRFQYRLGTEDQQALENLPEEWTPNHRGQGLAYVHIIIKEDFEVFPAFPTCLFRIKGRKVKVPGSSNKVWTDNAVAVVRDVLQTMPQISAKDEDFDEADFAREFEKAEAPWNYMTPGSNVVEDKKWSLNGGINLSNQPQMVIRSLRDHIGGFIEEYAGKWIIRVGEWTEPVADITESNLLSHISLNPVEPIRNRFNIVKGIYQGPFTEFRRTDFTPIEYEEEIEKEGKRIAVDLKLGLAKYQDLAQRIGHIALRKLHWTRGVAVGFFNYRDVKDILPGDNVTYQDEILGPLAANYQVIGKQIKAVEGGVGVQLVLRRTSEAIYNIHFDVTIPPLLPGHGVLSTAGYLRPSVIASHEIVESYETLSLRLKIIVGNHFVSARQIELQYRLRSGTEDDWINVGTSSYGTYFVTVPYSEDNVYLIRARAQTVFGGFTGWTTITHAVDGSLPEMPLPTNLRHYGAGPGLFLAWDIPNSPILSHTQVRHTPEISDNPDWDSMRVVADKIARPMTIAALLAAAGTYAVRAFNRLNQPSEEFSIIHVTDVMDNVNWNVVCYDEILPLDTDSTTPSTSSLHNVVTDERQRVFIQNPRPNEQGYLQINYPDLKGGVPKRLSVDYSVDNQDEIEDISQTLMLQVSTDGGQSFAPLVGGFVFLSDSLVFRAFLTNDASGRSPVISNLTTGIEMAV